MPAGEEDAARAFYGGVRGLREVDRSDRLFPGYRRLYADDGFGNRLEFLQRDA